MMVPVLLCCVLVVLTLHWWMSNHRPPPRPPGPGFALPVLGHLHLLSQDPRPKFHEWRAQHGDVFSLYFGSRLVVVFSGYSVLKEAFVKMADAFSDRPHLFMFDRISKSKGIILASGKSWREQRKTSQDILRELGMGRREMADRFQQEVSMFIAALEELGGHPTDLHRLTTISVSNVICSIVFGQRFQYTDPVFTGYLDVMENCLRKLGGAAVLNFVPMLECLPGDLFGIHKILSDVSKLQTTFLRPLIQKHIDTFRSSDEPPMNFIFAYLREMKRKKEEGMSSTLCEEHLENTVADMFVAGTQSSSATILWTLLLLLHYPRVQDACYGEIRDVVGPSRAPSVRDRPRLVYVEATICEVLRLVDVTPMAVQHSTPCDVTFRGFIIPKGAVIFPLLDTVLHDPDVWGDPQNFRPERFLDAEGKLTRPEEFIPFGLGRRACMGEALARMELLLYLSTLIQRFRFLPPEPEMIPPIKGHLSGGNFVPDPFRIRAVCRE